MTSFRDVKTALGSRVEAYPLWAIKVLLMTFQADSCSIGEVTTMS